MNRMRWSGFLLGIVATLAVAQTAPEQVSSRDGISYVSGGIGAGSAERLKAREKEFNLKLVFTLVEGNYLADVGVVIRDAANKVLVEHRAEGPFFMAKLPAGSYTVTATYEGKAQTRKVAVKDRLRTEYLRWPSNPQTDYALPPERAGG